MMNKVNAEGKEESRVKWAKAGEVGDFKYCRAGRIKHLIKLKHLCPRHSRPPRQGWK